MMDAATRMRVEEVLAGVKQKDSLRPGFFRHPMLVPASLHSYLQHGTRAQRSLPFNREVLNVRAAREIS
jgi:hypothetical protein